MYIKKKDRKQKTKTKPKKKKKNTAYKACMVIHKFCLSDTVFNPNCNVVTVKTIPKAKSFLCYLQ